MASKPDKGKKISRRGILPILGSTLLIPFVGYDQSGDKNKEDIGEDGYETLLRPDGTTVKVKISALKKSKIVKKNISNTTFLDWLGKKSGSSK
ncbi:hypothetical protein [Flagellimonas meishanensis]|uniref:hypothetical protein n=1 Tax=Flagellimonas meishanensis TaxID=2873264 RepID=UPI001CA6552C|nr:hypothetical protein [[Muricauda] meishanensis]